METDAGPAAWHTTWPPVLTPQPGMFSLLLLTRVQAESFPHLLSLQGPVMDLVCLMRAPCFFYRDPPALWGHLVASGVGQGQVAVVVIKSRWVGGLLPRNLGQGSPHFSTKSSSWDSLSPPLLHGDKRDLKT